MPGSGAEKRAHAEAKRCARLRREGFTLGQVASIVGIEKGKAMERIKLGERLLSLDEQP